MLRCRPGGQNNEQAGLRSRLPQSTVAAVQSLLFKVLPYVLHGCSWWEFVIRGVSVYLFLLVFQRLTGRRQTSQYAPFDLVLLLILSNAVQNSMNAGDNSLIGGLISAGTLLACHALLSRLSYRFARKLRRLVNGKPRF